MIGYQIVYPLSNLGTTYRPVFCFDFYSTGWGGEIFWQFSMFLSPTSPDPLLMHFIFCRKEQLFCFSFVFKKDEEEPSLNTVAPVRVKRSLIAFFMFLLLLFASSFFFSSSSDGALATALPFHLKEYVWCHMWRILVDRCAEPSKDTHLRKGWLMFIYTRRKEKMGKEEKKTVIECRCFIVRKFRLETSWLKTKWDAFDNFLQLFRKHKLEMSRFWCFVSLIFVSFFKYIGLC